MRKKPTNSKKGLTLLELMIAVSMMGIVALVGSTILVNVTKEKTLVENRNIVRQTGSLIGRISNNISTKVLPTQYDPFNVINFSNSRIGTQWTEVGDLMKSTTGVQTQEKGKERVVYDRSSLATYNTSKQIMTSDSVRYLTGCSDCSKCETAKDQAPVNAKECIPVNSCYYSSVQVGTKFSEKVSLCEKITAPTPGTYTVRSLSVGNFNGAQSSHDLVTTKLEVGKDLRISNSNYSSNRVYMSRCVPASDLKDIRTKYQTYSSIDTLRRPIIMSLENIKSVVQKNAQGQNVTVKVYTGSDIKCCTPPSSGSDQWTTNCSAISSGGTAQYLPTVFVYAGENAVDTYPALDERLLIPGLALVMQIDSASPKTFRLTTLLIENACKTGRRRSAWPCPEEPSNPYIAKNGDFDNQVEIKVLPLSGNVSSGIVGSGIINFGSSVNFSK